MPETATVLLTGPDGIDVTIGGVGGVRLRTPGGGAAEFVLGGGGGGPFAALVDRSITAVTAEDLAGVTEIGDYAFAGCTNLRTVTIPSNVTSIGQYAFLSCMGLTNIMFPNTLEYVYKGAFYNVHGSNMNSLVFPSSLLGTEKSGAWNLTDMFYQCGVQTIDLPDIDMLLNNTFGGLLYPQNLIIRSSTPPIPDQDDLRTSVTTQTTQSRSIDYLRSVGTNIYVPASAVSTYQNDQFWAIAASQIQSIQE